MGYSTDLKGAFDLDRPLSAAQRTYLEAFSETRRMHRHESLVSDLPDPVRVEAGLSPGEQGGYYVDDEGSGTILNYNRPPAGQPGLWCQWKPSVDGTRIGWDGGEKFYNYVEWIGYLIEHFLKPWGYLLNGTVTWQGENLEDTGAITITDNVVSVTGDPHGTMDYSIF